FSQFFSTSSEASFCPNLPCVINEILPGQTVTVPVRGEMGSHLNGAFQIIASVGSTGASNHDDPDEGQPGSNNLFTFSGAIEPGADLSLDLSLNTASPFFIGQTVSYRAIINNQGGQSASNLELEVFPDNLTVQSFAGCDSVNGNRCLINSLNAGQTDLVTIQVQVTGNDFLLNGEVEGAEIDLNLEDNVDEQGNQGSVGQADVSVSMSLIENPPYYSDQILQFSVRIRANGQPASNVRVWTELPGAGGSFLTADFCDGALPCVIDNMPANSERSAVFTYFAPVANDDGTAQDWMHRVYVEPGQVDSNPANNEAIIQNTSLAASNLVVRVELLSSGPFFADDVIEYEIELINGGVNRARDVALSTTPVNLEPVFVSGNLCPEVNCQLTAIDFNQRETLLVQYRIVDPGSFNLAASVSSITFDPNTGNNSDKVNGGVASNVLTDSIFTNRFE
ncbi:MAG: hypothetical protein AAGJ52_13670, partial [Pseudomonadota bacterium]